MQADMMNKGLPLARKQSKPNAPATENPHHLGLLVAKTFQKFITQTCFP